MRRDPSVTELMTRRLRVLASDPSPSTPNYRVDVTLAGPLAAALGRWDPRGAARTLRAEIERCERLFRKLDDHYNPEQLGMYIAEHTAALVRGGEDDALARFTQWLGEVGPARLGSLIERVFAPFVEFRDHPDTDAFLRWAFHARSSPFLPILRGDSRVGTPRVHALIRTQLIYVRPFRDRIVADLANTRVISEVQVRTNGSVTIAPYGEYGCDGADSRANGQPIRYCDVMAWLLHGWSPRDLPAFQPHWPLGERDHALAALRAYLENL
jgi:hypothetical protein